MSDLIRRFLNSPLGVGLIAVGAMVLIGGMFALSGAAASGEVLNETHTLTNDTTGVWVQVENTTQDADDTVYAEVYGINGSGETLVKNVSLTANGANTTDLAEVDINPSTYNETRVIVYETAESASSGLISRSGGGGLTGDGLQHDQILIGGLIVVVLAGVGMAVKGT